MDIRIPLDNEVTRQWNMLVNEMHDENIDVRVSDYKLMRDGETIRIRATLKPYDIKNKKYRPYSEQVSRNGTVYYRKVYAVCYHGHYEFLRRLFTRIPKAKVSSTMAKRIGYIWMDDYNFEEIAHEIADINVGSVLNPVAFSDKCRLNPNSTCATSS